MPGSTGRVQFEDEDFGGFEKNGWVKPQQPMGFSYYKWSFLGWRLGVSPLKETTIWNILVRETTNQFAFGWLNDPVNLLCHRSFVCTSCWNVGERRPLHLVDNVRTRILSWVVLPGPNRRSHGKLDNFLKTIEGEYEGRSPPCDSGRYLDVRQQAICSTFSMTRRDTSIDLPTTIINHVYFVFVFGNFLSFSKHIHKDSCKMHRALCPESFVFFWASWSWAETYHLIHLLLWMKQWAHVHKKWQQCKIVPENGDSWMLKKDDPNPSFWGPGTARNFSGAVRHWVTFSAAELLNFVGMYDLCMLPTP